MSEQSIAQYEQLLQTWQFRREVVNSYSRALQFLMLNNANGRQQWQELSERLAKAEKALQEVIAQMSRYEVAVN